MKVITVDLGERAYPIYVGAGLLELTSCFSKHIKGRQVCVVTNTTVANLYLNHLLQVLGEAYQVSVVTLPDGEEYKTLTTWSKIFDQLLLDQHNRTTTLIALGGGVVGDMTGFAAASYQRGVDFIQVPTTLLSQVDSSVGGKTGVNHPLGKNMIGAFHQPNAVVIDVNVLNSLPDRELSAGLAEVIKYGLIDDLEFFCWLEKNILALKEKNQEALIEAIVRSCEAKARVVAEDERESGRRALLNLGHTFGHAIESSEGYGSWLHGEAVGAGIVLAARLSLLEGWLSEVDVQRIVHLIAAAGLPTRKPEAMSVDDFLRYMSVDKKVVDGTLRLVLMAKLGCSIVTSDFSKDNLIRTLAE